MKSKSFLFLFFGLGLVGCATPEIVGQGISQGVPYVTVRYVNSGFESTKQDLRNEAIAKAKAQCGGGRIKLISDTVANEPIEPTAGSPPATYEVASFRYLRFECMDKKQNDLIY